MNQDEKHSQITLVILLPLDSRSITTITKQLDVPKVNLFSGSVQYKPNTVTASLFKALNITREKKTREK